MEDEAKRELGWPMRSDGDAPQRDGETAGRVMIVPSEREDEPPSFP